MKDVITSPPNEQPLQNYSSLNTPKNHKTEPESIPFVTPASPPHPFPVPLKEQPWRKLLLTEYTSKSQESPSPWYTLYQLLLILPYHSPSLTFSVVVARSARGVLVWDVGTWTSFLPPPTVTSTTSLRSKSRSIVQKVLTFGREKLVTQNAVVGVLNYYHLKGRLVWLLGTEICVTYRKTILVMMTQSKPAKRKTYLMGKNIMTCFIVTLLVIGCHNTNSTLPVCNVHDLIHHITDQGGATHPPCLASL